MTTFTTIFGAEAAVEGMRYMDDLDCSITIKRRKYFAKKLAIEAKTESLPRLLALVLRSPLA